MSWSITKAGSPASVADGFRAEVERIKAQLYAPPIEIAVLDAHAAAVSAYCDNAGEVTVIAESSGHVSVVSSNDMPSQVAFGNQVLNVRVLG